MKGKLAKKRKSGVNTVEAFGICLCNCSCQGCSCWCPNPDLFGPYDYEPGYGVDRYSSLGFEDDNTTA